MPRASHIPIATAAAVAAIATPLATLVDEFAFAPFSTAATVGSPHPTQSAIIYNMTSVILLLLHPVLLLLFTREQLPATMIWVIAPNAATTAKHDFKSQDTVVDIWVGIADWRRFIWRCSR